MGILDVFDGFWATCRGLCKLLAAVFLVAWATAGFDAAAPILRGVVWTGLAGWHVQVGEATWAGILLSYRLARARIGSR